MFARAFQVAAKIEIEDSPGDTDLSHRLACLSTSGVSPALLTFILAVAL
jgi:hypothetical protein